MTKKIAVFVVILAILIFTVNPDLINILRSRVGASYDGPISVVVTDIGKFRWKTAVEYEVRDHKGKLLGSDIVITEVKQGETKDHFFGFLKNYLNQRASIWLASKGKYTLKEMAYDRLTNSHFQKANSGDEFSDHKEARLARKRILASIGGNYPSFVVGTNEASKLLAGFTLQNEKIGAGTEILRPNGAGDGFVQWTYQVPDSGEHWDKVDETDVNDDDYIWATSGDIYDYDYYALQDTALTAETIDGIDVTYRTKVALWGEMYAGVRRAGSNTFDIARTPTSWTTYTKTSIARPGAGSWTVDDLDGLQIAGWNYTEDADQVYWSWGYITVNYAEGGAPVPEYSLLLAPVALGLPRLIRFLRKRKRKISRR